MLNIGDKVKVIKQDTNIYEDTIGDILFIESIEQEDSTNKRVYELSNKWWYTEDELEPITRNNKMNIKVKKLSPDAVIPKYAHSTDACFDLVACEDVIVKPEETVVIGTGLAFEIPEGYKMAVYPRSGICSKTPLRIANSLGIIDAGYRGEVKVPLWNSSSPHHMVRNKCKSLSNEFVQVETEINVNSYYIRKGDRIAQAEIVPIYQVDFTEVEELSESDRGDNGFGSSGHT